MLLFDILQMKMPLLKPEECKVHCACYNGFQDPLDVFISGNFQSWQEEQTQKNFERNYIVSLIQMRQANSRWLFAGLYRSLEISSRRTHSIFRINEPKDKELYVYKTELVENFEDITGRLIVSFEKSFRQPYPRAETVQNELTVEEYTRQRISVPDFSGYHKTSLMKSVLDIVIRESIPSYKAALSSVSGIYIITDIQTGKLYVGSAYGEDGGIWGRWTEYSESGHGGNTELKALIGSEGSYSENFQFSILEILDKRASVNDVFERECYWKDVLFSRKYGYNAN